MLRRCVGCYLPWWMSSSGVADRGKRSQGSLVLWDRSGREIASVPSEEVGREGAHGVRAKKNAEQVLRRRSGAKENDSN
jgi:hypothetical protein